MYDPVQYWEQRGKSYVAQEAIEEMAYLRSLVAEQHPQHILEVGPGSGRIWHTLHDLCTEWRCCDIVDSMRFAHQEATGVLPDKWDGVTLPYSERFSLVIAFNVLLHVPPADIAGLLSELKRCGLRIITATWDVPDGVETAPHVFRHDYNDLFRLAGLEVERTKYFGDRRIDLLSH